MSNLQSNLLSGDKGRLLLENCVRNENGGFL